MAIGFLSGLDCDALPAAKKSRETKHSCNHSAITDRGERMDEIQKSASETILSDLEESAKMRARAETATVPSKVGGLDGKGWRDRVIADPMRTLPPGAGFLIANYYETLLATRG
jgi:hypothetical protein